MDTVPPVAAGPLRVVTAAEEAPAADGGFSHRALFYDSAAEYRKLLRVFLAGDEESQGQVMVAVPRPAKKLVEEMRRRRPEVAFADMAELGRNPARIIPAAQSLAQRHPGQRLRCLWEPAWPGRSRAELQAVQRHEVLSSLAFTGMAITILCLYHTARLAPAVIFAARQTHPQVVEDGGRHASADYLGQGTLPEDSDRPLPPPPPDAVALEYGGDLRAVRAFTAGQARGAGLSSGRAGDLVIAVSELAANSLRHARGGGVLQVWCTHDEVLCQVHDSGRITDPLAGHRFHAPEAPGGHGLWLVNQVCDLVEMRTSAAGTTARVHMRLRPGR